MLKIKPVQGLLIILCSCFVLFSYNCSPKYPSLSPPIGDMKDFNGEGNLVTGDKWWKVFQDQNLNRMIDSALQSNLDLAATWQQFLAAKAVVKGQASNKWPEIEASAQSAINLPEPDFVGGENTQLGFFANYELDLWGRIGSAVRAEKFRAEASLFDYRAMAITLSAEIATTWYQLLAARKQLEITESQIATNEAIIKLIRSRFVGGADKGRGHP